MKYGIIDCTTGKKLLFSYASFDNAQAQCDRLGKGFRVIALNGA